jgi:hypothetical protein
MFYYTNPLFKTQPTLAKKESVKWSQDSRLLGFTSIRTCSYDMLRLKSEVLWKAWYPTIQAFGFGDKLHGWVGWMWVPDQLTIWAWFDFMNQLLDGINFFFKFFLKNRIWWVWICIWSLEKWSQLGLNNKNNEPKSMHNMSNKLRSLLHMLMWVLF